MSTESRVAEIKPQASWSGIVKEEPEPEPAKAEDAKPEEKSEPEPEPETEPAEADEDEEYDPNEDVVVQELRGLREDLRAAAGEKPKAADAPVVDEEMQAFLEHEDPVVRALARRVQQAETKIADANDKNARLEAAVNQQAVNRELEKLAGEYESAVKELGLTPQQVRATEHYMLSDPEIARTRTFADAAKELFGAKSAPGPKPAPRSGKPAAPREDGPAATLVDAGGSAAPARANGAKPDAPAAPPRVKSIEQLLSRPGMIDRLR